MKNPNVPIELHGRSRVTGAQSLAWPNKKQISTQNTPSNQTTNKVLRLLSSQFALEAGSDQSNRQTTEKSHERSYVRDPFSSIIFHSWLGLQLWSPLSLSMLLT